MNAPNNDNAAPVSKPVHELSAWRKLQTLSAQERPHLRELLKDDVRNASLHLQAMGLEIDLSCQRLDGDVLQALLELAQQSNLSHEMRRLFLGHQVNTSEQRAALHPALRNLDEDRVPWGPDIAREVNLELNRFCAFAEKIRAHELHGFSNESFTDVVNLGIGGSDLGPRMCVQALSNPGSTPFNANALLAPKVHFVSNVDAWALFKVIRDLNPRRTLFIIQSKTFLTQETLLLAESAKAWLLEQGCEPSKISLHFAAVTANTELAIKKGYQESHIFKFWDWVGGRYSVWSAIGLPLAIAIGEKQFKSFLDGAKAMDEHFQNAPWDQNLPVMLAMVGIWNNNFLKASTHNVAPYSYLLSHFTPYLQQLEMESNGKGVDHQMNPMQVNTAPIVWGGLGIDGQHAYFQLLHQGSHLVSVDFIGLKKDDCPLDHAQAHHECLVLNMKAQAKALAEGRSLEDTQKELAQSGLSSKEIEQLAGHRTFRGNSPSTSIWLDEMSPKILGALMALYEHKVFAQAAIWSINPFDQWGVELGKKIAQQLKND